MPLIPERVVEISRYFGAILPIYDMKGKSHLEVALGVKFEEIVPEIMNVIAATIVNQKHIEDAEGILDWLSHAILYMKGEVDDLPEMQIETTDNQGFESLRK